MKAPNELYVVEGGDHSLAVAKNGLKAGGKNHDDVNQEILQRVLQFVQTR